MSPRHPVGTTVLLLAFAAIAFATLLPTDVPPGDSEMLCLVCGVRGGVDALLNILLFVPLGFGARLAGLGRARVVALVAATTGIVELLQLEIVTGRDASLGDVLFNTAGGVAGALIAERWRSLISPTAGGARALAAGGVASWFAVLAATAVLLAPSLPGRRFEWAIAPSLDGTTRFVGVVLDASLAERPTVAGILSRSDVLDALGDSGVRVGASVVPAATPAGLAPLVRLSNERDGEIVMLSQLGDLLVFEARTRAADVRLRPPSVTLGDVFPADGAPAGAAVVRARGDFHDGRLVATASSSGETRGATLDLRPTLGWMLLVPGRIVVPGAPDAITLLWIGAFLVPVGYWAGPHQARSVRLTNRGALRGLALFGLPALAGLAAAPLLPGMHRATALEWLVAVASLAAGAGLAAVAERRRLGAPAPRRMVRESEASREESRGAI